jgi:hypothetical protein
MNGKSCNKAAALAMMCIRSKVELVCAWIETVILFLEPIEI